MNKNPFASHSRLSCMAFFEESFIKSWWVFVFCIFCFGLYENAMQRQDSERETLKKKFHQLEVAKNSELDAQQNLLFQVNSQSDYCWTELTLMKVLGLVPEGFTKVYFTQ